MLRINNGGIVSEGLDEIIAIIWHLDKAELNCQIVTQLGPEGAELFKCGDVLLVLPHVFLFMNSNQGLVFHRQIGKRPLISHLASLKGLWNIRASQDKRHISAVFFDQIGADETGCSGVFEVNGGAIW